MASEACIALLEATKDYISSPDRWCQNKPQDGERRCVWAALTALAPTHDIFFEAYSILEKLAQPSLTKFNDTRTHDEVLALMDQGLAIAKGEGRSENSG